MKSGNRPNLDNNFILTERKNYAAGRLLRINFHVVFPINLKIHTLALIDDKSRGMKKQMLLLFFFSGMVAHLESCNPSSESGKNFIAQDSVSILTGKSIFSKHCSTCHNFRQDGIGPQLGGITKETSVDWIKNFIRNPGSVISSGDERAKKLAENFRTVMPAFDDYTEQELDAIISFLHTKDLPALIGNYSDTTSLKNPILETIPLSDLVVELEPFCQLPPSGKELPLTRINKLDFHPGTHVLFILDLRGKLYKIENKVPAIYMDMMKLKSNFIHQPGLATGFGSFAFHPEFEKNGLLYTTHTESPGSGKADFAYSDSIPVTLQWVLTEWKTDQHDGFPFSGKARELFRVNMVSSLHGIQEITFNPLSKPGAEDYGLLYIGVGDGGSVENGFSELAHSTGRIWGTILRIDPLGRNSLNKQYGIPENNPFSGSKNKKIVKEIYAFGFRNPHRITWSRSGMMLASNIGHGNIESVNLVLPGHDYGWPIREGTFAVHLNEKLNNIYPLPPDDSIYSVTYPVVQYDHDDGRAISGGFEYTGSNIPELTGKYLFGDIVNGRLFYIETSAIAPGKQASIKEWKVSLDGKKKTLIELCGTGRVDLRLGRDAKGEMYLFTKPDGMVYKLVSTHKHPL